MTDLIVRGRQGGKTTAVILLAAQHSAHIVCRSRQRARQIARQAAGMGLDIPFPLTADEFFRGQWHAPGINGFLIDDLDQILALVAGRVPVIAVTWPVGEGEPEAGDGT